MVMDSKLGKSGGKVHRVSRKEISVDTVERAINLDTNELMRTSLSWPNRTY